VYSVKVVAVDVHIGSSWSIHIQAWVAKDERVLSLVQSLARFLLQIFAFFAMVTLYRTALVLEAWIGEIGREQGPGTLAERWPLARNEDTSYTSDPSGLR
jgi:hypothetical protein